MWVAIVMGCAWQPSEVAPQTTQIAKKSHLLKDEIKHDKLKIFIKTLDLSNLYKSIFEF